MFCNKKKGAFLLLDVFVMFFLMIATPCAKASPKVAILYDELFLLHKTVQNHPERPARLTYIIDAIKADKALENKLYWPAVKPATVAQVRLVHTPEYIKLVEDEVNGVPFGKTHYLSTGDTPISAATFSVAKMAVGAGITAADEIMLSHASSAFALVRPPGHHATTSKGMGFCVFNNIAITARYLQKKYGIERILIVDFDVHHGNGTQDIFYDDDSIFYFSVHQSPLYPYSGQAGEKGANNGYGYTMNVPLQAGSSDDDILKALNKQLKPAMLDFKPEFILVSAGIDSHADDLLGGLNYSDQAYNDVALFLKALSHQTAQDRILYILEGGYTLDNLKNSVLNILHVMTD